MAFPPHADYAAAQNSVYEYSTTAQNLVYEDYAAVQNPGNADFTSAQNSGHADYTTAQNPEHADFAALETQGGSGHADYNSWDSSYAYRAHSQRMEWRYNELGAVKDEPHSDYDGQELQHELQSLRQELLSLRQRVTILERRGAASGRCCRFCSRCSRLVQQLAALENAVQPLLSRTVHWYLDNSMQASLLNYGNLKSEEYAIYGYSIRMAITTRRVNGEVWVGMYVAIWPGPCDAQLEWPFRKPYTLSLMHPEEEDRSIHRRIDPRESDQDTVAQYFERPAGQPNRAYGCRMATLESIRDCFGNGRLHLSLNVEI